MRLARIFAGVLPFVLVLVCVGLSGCGVVGTVRDLVAPFTDEHGVGSGAVRGLPCV